MSIPGWLFVVGIAAAVLAGVGFIMWIVSAAVEDYSAMQERKQFDRELPLAIAGTRPPLEQILAIAATRKVSRGTVYWNLQRLLREILTGRNTDLAPYRTVVEGYLSAMKELDPFEGIPDEIRIHLERMQKHLAGTPDALQPLTDQIRELVAINERDRRHQKYYTVGGFVLGMVGLLFAAYAYFYPYPVTQPDTSNSPPDSSPTK